MTRRDDATLVDTTEAADILAVPRDLIAKWKHRGLVTPVGLIPGRGKGVPLYDLRELLPLAERYHQRRLGAL
ncbi:hypothetical protein [Nocardioides sp. LHG3406-4]|uniref:hypothetical protein n=1 Tax=Nocardioides sp. LHG3406-4 TaxID=2804575 RepID=UPI003CEAEA32